MGKAKARLIILRVSVPITMFIVNDVMISFEQLHNKWNKSIFFVAPEYTLTFLHYFASAVSDRSKKVAMA